MTTSTAATTTQWAEAIGRSAVYALLAHTLTYPDATRIGAARRQLAPLLREIETGDPDTDGALSRVLDTLDTPLADLRRAFVRQFAHVASPDCPTYETAYSDREIFWQAQEMADIAGFYRAFGFQVGGRERERPDHIGPELEFLSLLTRKEARALEQGRADDADACRNARAAFLRDHVGCWAPALGMRIARLGTLPFYREGGALLHAWLRWEMRGHGVEPVRTLDEPQPLPPPEVDEACAAARGCAADASPNGFVDVGAIR